MRINHGIREAEENTEDINKLYKEFLALPNSPGKVLILNHVAKETTTKKPTPKKPSAKKPSAKKPPPKATKKKVKAVFQSPLEKAYVKVLDGTLFDPQFKSVPVPVAWSPED